MNDPRQLALSILVALGVAVLALTELLGAFHLLRPGPLAAAWAIVAAAVLWTLWRRGWTWKRPNLNFPEAAAIAAIGAILVLVGVTARLSPPNSADAMAYHLPRVVYWAQAGSVSFFPTDYFNQIMLQPLAEYFMLHTFLLSGGDSWVNLIASAGFAGSIVGASLIARELGAGRRGQLIAAVFCATIPNAILQASGSKNDGLLALWLTASVYFALWRSMTGLGLSLGLALMTKGTAYLFAPAVLLPIALQEPKRFLRGALTVVGCALLLNGPHYYRNFVFSGSPLGFDSAQGDGVYRWRNEPLGPRATASNVLRNLADHLGTRSAAWNQGVYDTVARLHEKIGIDLNDRGTTWPGDTFRVPINSNHEADSPNRWQLFLLAGCGFALVRAPRRWQWYYLGIVLGFVLFCFYVKWMPWITRLHLPLFVLAAPVIGLFGEKLRPAWLQAGLCLFLLNNSRPYLWENWVRPLEGPRAVWRVPRDRQYFSDMASWSNQATYFQTAAVIRESGCDRIGIDIHQFQLEYPLQALLRQAMPGMRFVHTGVQNASSRYKPDPSIEPCAVVCLDCAGQEERLKLYQDLGEPQMVDRFALFFRR